MVLAMNDCGPLKAGLKFNPFRGIVVMKPIVTGALVAVTAVSLTANALLYLR